MGFGFGLGLGKRVRGKWGWGWGLKIYPWTGMEMKIILANGGGPGMDGVFLSGYGDGDYTPRPRFGPLPSLRITLRGKGPRVLGQRNPSHQWDMHGHRLFLHPPVWVKGTSISPRVSYVHLLPYRQAREVRAWVGAKDRAYKLGHQGYRDMSTPAYHPLSQQISQLYRVCFCYLAYGQECYLIMVLCIHSLLHQL